jgi:GWxTD domain-containing protein
MLPFFQTLFRRFSGLVLLVVSVSCTLEKTFSEQNLAHLYGRNPPISVGFSLAASPEEVVIFCGFTFQFPEFSAEKPGFWEKYCLSYQIRPGFESSRILRKDTLSQELLIRGTGMQPVFQIALPRSDEDRLLILKIRHRYATEETVYFCRIPGDASGELSPFALFKGKIPVTNGQVKPGDTLLIRSFDFRKTSVQVEFSPFPDAVAMPPMATVALLDTSEPDYYPVSIGLNEYRVFRKQGYYKVKDPEGNGGFGFILAGSAFPGMTQSAELIPPLVYISSREERKALLSPENPKLALDQFWLNISPQKDRAREIIRKYYLNIEDANRLFSQYKEGWKTDRGMVMAIFGPPYQVFQNQEAEVWIYDKGHGPENSVFYFFRKRAGNFADIWELKRLSDYDKIWYGVVDLWRKGLIDR